MKIAFAAAAIAAVAAGPGAAAQNFPHAEADTLDGAHMTFPDAARGRPAAFVIAVERAASANQREWTRRLASALRSKAPVYAVVAADGVPFFLKGKIHAALRRDVPTPIPGENWTFLLTFNGSGWKTVVGGGKADEPEIVVIDSAGQVTFAQRSAPDDAVLAAAIHAVTSPI